MSKKSVSKSVSSVPQTGAAKVVPKTRFMDFTFKKLIV